MNEEAKKLFDPESSEEGLPGGEMTVYQSGSSSVQLIKNLVPNIDFEAMENFYAQIEEIVKKSFKHGYHFGPAYEAKPGKAIPPDILYKRGMQLFHDRLSLIFQEEISVIEEENNVTTFHCKTKMFRQVYNENTNEVREIFLGYGEGSCSTDEGRFSYSKVITRQVREGAVLRAHKDAAERFFNISRFFPNDPELKKPEPSKQPKPKKEYTPNSTPHTVRWNPTPNDVNNPEWYKAELNKLTTYQDVSLFTKEFATEISCFGEKDAESIKALAREKFLTLGGDPNKMKGKN